jgi:hypothetical protein
MFLASERGSQEFESLRGRQSQLIVIARFSNGTPDRTETSRVLLRDFRGLCGSPILLQP